jgi:hypothetical protein
MRISNAGIQGQAGRDQVMGTSHGDFAAVTRPLNTQSPRLLLGSSGAKGIKGLCDFYL